MSQNTKIEWTDHSWNPWEGCQKVSPGCDHCYAKTRNACFGGGQAQNWGPGAPRRRTSAANWRKPFRWNLAHAAFAAVHGRRQRVFCASLSDVFDNEVPIEWFIDMLDVWRQTPNLDKLVLTKRIGNAMKRLGEAFNALMLHDDYAENPLVPWLATWIAGNAPARISGWGHHRQSGRSGTRHSEATARPRPNPLPVHGAAALIPPPPGGPRSGISRHEVKRCAN